MKKVVFSAGIMSVALLAACGSSESNEVVVSSDAGDITKDEFYEVMKQENGSMVLNGMLEQQILMNNYEVSEEEIEEEMESVRQEMGGEEGFSEALEMNGLTEDVFKDDIEVSIAYQKAIVDELGIDEDFLTEHVEENEQNYRMVDASHILVEDETLAEELVNRIAEGEDFGELAVEYSEDGSAAENGHLGEFGRGEMVPEFEDEAFDLDAGEVSGVVESDFGFHVIKVNDYQQLTVEENYKEIEQRYIMEHGDLEDEFFQAMLDEANVEFHDEDLDFVTPEEQMMP